jgi:uncharacterized protein YneF (UPF0154 family)
MNGGFQLFTTILCVTVVLSIIIGGGLPILLAAVAGYFVSVHFIETHLKK